MKYFCLERCFDSGKCRGYYEEEVYNFGSKEVKHLKDVGLLKYFKEMPVEEIPEKEPEEKSAEQPDQKIPVPPKTAKKG